MANFHLEIKNIGRCKNKSFVRLVNYNTGERLRDCYNDITYYNTRDDVLLHKIILPPNAPEEFNDLQTLCTEIDNAEKRYDSRTAREYIGSLPNELPLEDLFKMVNEFVYHNFTEYGLAAIVAIHNGINRDDPYRNNPHVHILVSTRTVNSDGFSKHKFREFNKRKYVRIWRERWADVQNRAYRDRGLDISISCESLADQGIDREPIKHLPLAAWRREAKGIRTDQGDINRAIRKRNAERERRKELQRNMYLERAR